MVMGDLVRHSEDGAIATIALNAPETLNALSPEMLDDLAVAIDRFDASESARVAILKGNGRGFCSGFNMSRSKGTYRKIDHTPWGDRQRLRGYAETYLRLWDCSKPVIAQVHGFCMAGGVQLPMCCDIVVVSENVRIGWPKLPTGGGWIGPMFTLFAGPHRAKQMSMVAGSEMNGARAVEWGYANFAVPAEDLDDAVHELAAEMTKLPISMLQLKKAAINRVWDRLGFREVVLAGVEWDVFAHKDPGSEELRSWLREDGMKAAIARFQKEGL
jgi:enoyl-CoA hydratase